MPKVSALPTQKRFNGYSDAQVENILGEIANTADLMKSFSANPSTDDEVTRLVLGQLAQRIGILADMANSHAIWNGAAGWLLGPDCDAIHT